MPLKSCNLNVHYLMQIGQYDLAAKENVRWWQAGKLSQAQYLANEGLIALGAGNTADALRQLTLALELDPENSDIASCLIFLWQALGEHDRAATLYSSHEHFAFNRHRKECYRHHLDQAQNYQSFKKFDHADNEIKEARMLFPKKPEVHLAEGKNHLSAKRWEQAIFAFDKAMQLAEDEETKSECLTYLAITHLRIEQREKAEDYLMEALDQNPPYMGALMLSDYLFSRKDMAVSKGMGAGDIR